MRLTIFGTGYVGVGTGACLTDADADRIVWFEVGEVLRSNSDFHEVIACNVKKCTLEFNVVVERNVPEARAQLVADDTQFDNGVGSFQCNLASAEPIGVIARRKTAALKSKISMRTSDRVRSGQATYYRHSTLGREGAAPLVDWHIEHCSDHDTRKTAR